MNANLTPDRLLGLRDSIYATDLLITAISKLNFFSWLSQNPSSKSAISEQFKIKARPLDVMITLFKAWNLVIENNGVISVSAESELFLTDNSATNLTGYYNTQAGRPMVNKMMEVLVSDKPVSWGAEKDMADWEKALDDEEFARKFTMGMDSRGHYYAPSLTVSFPFYKYKAVLDIGGASGIYSTYIKRKYSGIKVSVLERKPVDKITRLCLADLNMDSDIEVITGDMFHQDIPGGYDIHLFSHVMHDWNSEQVEFLISQSYKNLEQGGVIIIHDAHLNQEKSGPQSVAEYSVLLMFSTPGKCYSTGELTALLEKCGFLSVSYKETTGNRSIIYAVKPEK